jgi:hypothetical protein
MDFPETNAQVSSANATTLKPDYKGKRGKRLQMVMDYVTKHTARRRFSPAIEGTGTFEQGED